SMFFRASLRAPWRSPACACSAPQQTWSGGVLTFRLLALNTRSVARFTRAKSPSPTQPANNNTFSPVGLDFSVGLSINTGRELSSSASPNSARGEISRARLNFNSSRARPESRNKRDAAKKKRRRRGDNQILRRTILKTRLAKSDFG